MSHRWTSQEDQFLIDYVKGISLNELTDKFNSAFNLNLSESSISNRKVKLGIKSGFNSSYFKKGQTPFNKGKKWEDYMTEEGQKNSLKTCFKKENKPHNYKKIGSEVYDKDNYAYIKVRDNPYERRKNWISKQRLIYEQHYGPIPEGYVVIFADGDVKNFNIDNLILVSRQENLIMNNHGLRYHDKDLTKVGVNIAKLIDTTNKKKNVNKS